VAEFKALMTFWEFCREMSISATNSETPHLPLDESLRGTVREITFYTERMRREKRCLVSVSLNSFLSNANGLVQCKQATIFVDLHVTRYHSRS
jgi:hypothetical protein